MSGFQELQEKKYMLNKPTEEQIFRYVIDHRNEDFPMDQTLEEFYEKVLAYAKIMDEIQQFSTEVL